MKNKKTLLLTIGGIISIVMLLLYKSCRNSMDERGSRTAVSYSSQESRDRGTFVSTAKAHPDSFHVSTSVTRVKEAWIERMSQVNYHLLFFKSREYLNEYSLVIRFNDSIENADHFVLGSVLRFPFMLQTDGGIYVASLHLGEIYPDSLAVTVEDRNDTVAILNFDLR